MYSRWSTPALSKALRRPYVHILFGARQTGKSTMLRSLLPEADLWLDFSDPGQRVRYLARPELLIEECAALQPARKPRWIVIDGPRPCRPSSVVSFDATK